MNMDYFSVRMECFTVEIIFGGNYCFNHFDVLKIKTRE